MWSGDGIVGYQPPLTYGKLDIAWHNLVWYRVLWYGVVRNGMLQWCGYDMWSDDGIVGSRPSDVGTAFEQQQGGFLCSESIFH